MRESFVEAYLVNQVQKVKNAICWKWQSSRRGVPDRIVLLPIPEEHRAIVAKYVRLVEVKAPGEKPTLQQTHVHKLLAEKGFDVTVVDHPAAIDEFMKGLM
jgi:hypothetical protein